MPREPKEDRAVVIKRITSRRGEIRSTDSGQQGRPAKSLSKRIKGLLDDLKYAEQSLECWANSSAEKIEGGFEAYSSDQSEYDRIVGRLIRAGEIHHPAVQLWLEARRSLGEREVLRKYRLGLERGVKRTMSKENFWVCFKASSLVEKGQRPEEIRRSLIRELRFDKSEPWFDLSDQEINKFRDRLRSSSRQNFHRYLRRLGVWPP